MKTVFHIITHFDVGGAERVALNIAKSDTEDFEYHVVEVVRGRSDYTHSFISEMEACGIQYHRSYVPVIPFHYLFERIAALLFPLWFIFIFLKFRPQVIHCHTEIPEMATCCFFSLFPWLLKRCSVVRTIHNTKLWTGMEIVGPKVEKFMQRQRSNIAISESVQQNYYEQYGEEPPIVFNGVAPQPQKVYAPLVEGRCNVLFAGRFEEQKGVDVLADIITGLSDDIRYYFYVIGDGRQKEYLIRSLVNQQNVSILPPVYGLSAFLASFDYLLMPSRHEGLSMLAIEASFQQLPVIINNCLGLSDTLPEDWPLKVNNNRLGEYMNIFKSVLPVTDRVALGTRARTFAEQHFGLRQMQTNYEKIYNEKLKQS